MQEVFIADSAAVARKILEANKVDIMLTDIEMPGEDGISLQKWQAVHYPQVCCIFLTSHADFSYAKEAIHNARLITSCSLQAFRISRKLSAGASGS